ncbi:hypothetical protein LOK49_LG13G01149 [Camellia lanceoleosa]|uniref:Uncharacterized protein n=1 Tax=Camellia lanceoleosa TaxID=1840588 RepID=A0ACC0FI39_9ERIC|nr:hypothetical protein LOK49_LG13G01149 [Camellia lanceoleosa]
MDAAGEGFLSSLIRKERLNLAVSDLKFTAIQLNSIQFKVPTRLPGFSPTMVLDFGAGTGSAANLICPIWLLG